jgi:hypothetical protein
METQIRSRARASSIAIAALLAVMATTIALPMSERQAEAASAKVTICHRTHATTNPYRRITVSQSAITRSKGHGDHVVTNGNPPVYDSTFTYASNNKIWGDVIPGGDAAGTPYNGTTSIATNWTTAGKALFSSSASGALSAKQFYDVEIAAGVPEADVLADLNSQGANEDMALLAALGGSFTAGNLTQWETAVTVTTVAASAVTATTATLNGTLTVGTTSTVTGFSYGTSSTLATSTSAPATPSPITGSNVSITASLTGLLPSTTYYFRATGTTNAGTDTEGILTGAILAFTTPAAATTTTSTTSTTAAAEDTTTTSTTTPDETTTTSTTPEETTTTTTSTTTPDETTTTTSTSTTSTTAPPEETTTTSTSTSTTTTSTTAPPSNGAPPTSTSTTATTELPDAGAGDSSPPPEDADTPAPPTVVSPAADGTIRGIVWFDRNHNGVYDGREWILPGVTVSLSEAFDAASIGRTVEAASVATTAVTDKDGAYLFTHLPAGAYEVSAAANIKGFDRTSDTDGALDWVVKVPVKVRAVGIADFAGLGRGELVGTMFETTTGRGLGAAAVTCTWGGYDDRLGNSDDLPFDVTAADDGSFDMKGVPYGNFACAGTDRDGRTSAVVAAAVFSPDPVRAPLPVTLGVGGSLPRTGLDLLLPLAVSVACLAFGLAALRVSRRRRAAPASR